MSFLLACAPGNESETASLYSQSTRDLDEQSTDLDRNQKVSIAVSSGYRSGTAFSLTSSLQDVAYQIDQCVSGLTANLTSSQIGNFSLYRYDQQCRISLVEVVSQDRSYVLANSGSFIDEVGAVNELVSESGHKVFVIPVKTLPAALTQTSYELEYLITGYNQGPGAGLNIQEVGIFSDTASIMENDPSPILVTVARSNQAQGSLQVSLQSVGSALHGVDFSGLPATVNFDHGEFEKHFTLNVINNDIMDGNREIKIAFLAGPFLASPQYEELIITIIDNDVPMAMLELIGNGNLGQKPLGVPLQQQIELINNGSLPATITSVNFAQQVFSFVGGSYPGSGGSCGTVLGADAICTLMLTTDTSQLGLKADHLQVSYSDQHGNRVLNQSIQLNVVEGAHLVLSENLLDFGSHGIGSTVYKQVTLTNEGASVASLIGQLGDLSLPFYFPGGFPGDGSSCGSSLGVGQSCQLVLGFGPMASGSYMESAVIRYEDGAGGIQQVSLPLVGEGASLGFLMVSNAPSFNFGAGVIGETMVHHFVLTNQGQSLIGSLNVSLSGSGFAFAGNGNYPGLGANCGNSLAAGQQCTVAVAFTPNQAGQYQGSLQLTYHNQTNWVSTSVGLSGSASSISAVAETYITGLNQSVAVQLKAKNGQNPLQFVITSQPDHGNLTGTAPNLTYVPQNGFAGRDYFSFQVSDSQGLSQVGLIRIIVAPKALYVAASSLGNLDQQIVSTLQAQGFQVSTRADSMVSFADSVSKDLVLVSQSVNANTLGSIFRNLQIPFIAWATGVYSHMGMSHSSWEMGTLRTEFIRIINSQHPMAAGYANGLVQVLGHFNYHMPYIVTNHPNVQRVATLPDHPNRTIIFGYESQVVMGGGVVAPARRVGTYLSGSGPAHGLTTHGVQIFRDNVRWAMAGVDSLFVDHFERPNSTVLGNSWVESSPYQTDFRVQDGRLAVTTDSQISSVRRGFDRRYSGVMTAQFMLNLKRMICEEAAWSQNNAYDTNHRVAHQGNIWRARWWTQGEEPGTTGQWGVWELVGPCSGSEADLVFEPGCGASWWNAQSIYLENQKVAHQGKIWRARWYTQGVEPGTAGQWGVWEDLGVCTEDPPAEPNYWLRFQLGQCDLMNHEDPAAGVVAELVWGGPQAGLSGHQKFAVSENGGLQTIGELGNGFESFRLVLNIDQQQFRLIGKNFETESINFASSSHVDCVRVIAKDINAAGFSGHHVDNIRIFAAE